MSDPPGPRKRHEAPNRHRGRSRPSYLPSSQRLGLFAGRQKPPPDPCLSQVRRCDQPMATTMTSPRLQPDARAPGAVSADGERSSERAFAPPFTLVRRHHAVPTKEARW